MIKGRQYAIVFALLIMMVTALNISNGAINQLTGENRPAIIGADYQQSNICFYLLGKSYIYEGDKLQELRTQADKQSRRLTGYLTHYFNRYMEIFQAVFPIEGVD